MQTKIANELRSFWGFLAFVFTPTPSERALFRRVLGFQ
jgi:hypothetical protein